MALAMVCLVRLNNLPSVGVKNVDKIFHFSSYFVLALLWYGTFTLKFSIKYRKAIIYTIFSTVAFGMVIEVLQGALTRHRTFDINDAMANTFGVLLAMVIVVLKKITVKN